MPLYRCIVLWTHRQMLISWLLLSVFSYSYFVVYIFRAIFSGLFNCMLVIVSLSGYVNNRVDKHSLTYSLFVDLFFIFSVVTSAPRPRGVASRLILVII